MKVKKSIGKLVCLFAVLAVMLAAAGCDTGNSNGGSNNPFIGTWGGYIRAGGQNISVEMRFKENKAFEMYLTDLDSGAVAPMSGTYLYNDTTITLDLEGEGPEACSYRFDSQKLILTFSGNNMVLTKK